jgi:hypothetical protein
MWELYGKKRIKEKGKNFFPGKKTFLLKRFKPIIF